MKSLTILLFVVLGITIVKAQKQNIETQSVSINNIINFVAENYEYQDESSSEIHNITFAIQVANSAISTEDLVVLKQTFKLMSERLIEKNTISIITYFGFSGVALEKTSTKELDNIYKVLGNLKESINEFKDDGIALAYQYAKDNYDEEAINTIIIVRNANAAKPDLAKMSLKEKKKIKRKKRNKAILITAVGLLPELITLLNK